MRQPAGREAYPGDVFHIHARLLERSAKLSKELGGGSLTALPIAQTEGGNLSAYIPTNLISITDGQIVLSSKLFAEGQKPAVDIGPQRQPGRRQDPGAGAARAGREPPARLRPVPEVELFTRFSTTLDPRTQAQIDHGRRIRAVLTQPQHVPMSLAHEAAELLALREGLLDALPLDRMEAFKAQAPAWLDERCKAVMERIETDRTLEEADRALLRAALSDLADSLKPAPAPAAPPS
ncbi:MAG: hypothetical protein WDM92_03630 [Caulobacteraceae bacterium]